MSKAFTKESDGENDEPIAPYVPPWPPGARNYLTAACHARLRAEREALQARPASSLGREEQRRLLVLAVHLEAAEPVVPPAAPIERVQFGTTVRVRGDRERSYSIVGVDEVDVARGHVAWCSPIARALTAAKVGDEVLLRSPRGEETLTVIAISALEP